MSKTPVITDMKVIPCAGYDSMLLSLSGAHGPLFTRNIVIITDNSGSTGIGEVHGGDDITKILDDTRQLIADGKLVLPTDIDQVEEWAKENHLNP